MVIEGGPHFKQVAEGDNVKVIGQYHSGLEHTFLWIVDARDGKMVDEVHYKQAKALLKLIKK